MSNLEILNLVMDKAQYLRAVGVCKEWDEQDSFDIMISYLEDVMNNLAEGKL